MIDGVRNKLSETVAAALDADRVLTRAADNLEEAMKCMNQLERDALLSVVGRLVKARAQVAEATSDLMKLLGWK